MQGQISHLKMYLSAPGLYIPTCEAYTCRIYSNEKGQGGIENKWERHSGIPQDGDSVTVLNFIVVCLFVRHM